MTATPTPIKRSEQLAPLSREHHEGLLFVWKIRQGLRNQTDAKMISAFAQWFWENHLKAHMQQEEELLSKYLPPTEEMLQRMLDEHLEIEAQFEINANIPDATLLELLATTVNDHIRFEERQFFPHVEQQLTMDQLNELAASLQKEKPACAKWENEFWLRK
jgi:hemerythrin-like domain-containing protein